MRVWRKNFDIHCCLKVYPPRYFSLSVDELLFDNIFDDTDALIFNYCNLLTLFYCIGGKMENLKLFKNNFMNERLIL